MLERINDHIFFKAGDNSFDSLAEVEKLFVIRKES